MRFVSFAAAIEAGPSLVRRPRTDVLHLHSPWLWDIAAAIRCATDVPIVYTAHSIDRAEVEAGEWLPHGSIQDDVLLGADRVIALSQSELGRLRAYYPDIRNRVHVVGNGICEPPRLPRRPPKDTIDILYVGRFANRKGMVDLFEALAMGMSQGLAVVVTDAGGPAEIVDHGVTGLVVAPRRPADLARRSWISAATRSCGCGSDEPRAGSWPSGTRAGRWYARWKRSTTRHAGRETSDERQRRGCSMRRNTFSVSRWSDGRTLLCAPSLLPPGASAHAQSIVPVAQTSAPERAR